MGNYKTVGGASRDIFPHDSDGERILDEDGIRIVEMYHDQSTGNVVITYTSEKRLERWVHQLQAGGSISISRTVRIEDPDSHWFEVPVKATNKWNSFVESLPEWDPDQ